jgi:hypothetical protein
MRFHENPSSESQVVDRQTEGWTNMTKIIIAFCNFANKLKVTKFPKAPQKALETDTHKTSS